MMLAAPTSAITLLERFRDHRIARIGIDECGTVGNLLLVLPLRAVYCGATATRIEEIDWRKQAWIVFRQFDRPAEVSQREIGLAAIKIRHPPRAQGSGVLRVALDRGRIIGNGALGFAHLEQRLAALGIAVGVFGVDADRLAGVLHRR